MRKHSVFGLLIKLIANNHFRVVVRWAFSFFYATSSYHEKPQNNERIAYIPHTTICIYMANGCTIVYIYTLYWFPIHIIAVTQSVATLYDFQWYLWYCYSYGYTHIFILSISSIPSIWFSSAIEQCARILFLFLSAQPMCGILFEIGIDKHLR